MPENEFEVMALRKVNKIEKNIVIQLNKIRKRIHDIYDKWVINQQRNPGGFLELKNLVN